MESERKTLLLVEDEAIVALTEKAALTREGYSVMHARSGEEALDTVTGKLGSTIDLILMDIDLGGGIDGTKAAQEILKCHDIPVVFLSSHTEKELVEKTEAITNYGYIVKNLGNTVLFTAIKMAFKLYKAHRKIEESEERFRYLIENIPEGMSIMDEADRFVFANPAAHSILGVEQGRLLGEPLSNFMDSHNAAIVEAQNAIRRKGGTGEYEQEIIRADGERRTIQVKSNPQFDEKRRFKGSFVVFEDITEEKAARERLRESEAEYRSLFEDSANAILEEDFSGLRSFLDELRSRGERDPGTYLAEHPDELRRCISLIRIVRWNKEWLKVSGVEEGEKFETSPIPDERDRSSLDGFRQEILALAEGRMPFEYEFPNSHLSSKVAWIKLRMALVPGHEQDWSKVFVSFMDITEQKKAQGR
jgi:PAS domain S-box-containing protein